MPPRLDMPKIIRVPIEPTGWRRYVHRVARGLRRLALWLESR
jgi:hypothetical protein